MGCAIQCLLITLMFSTQLARTSPVCEPCPAGQYQKSCSVCEPCPARRYMDVETYEDRCYECFKDCRADFNLKVVHECNSTSDLRCECETGYRCIDHVPYSENCRRCEKIQELTPTDAAPVISAGGKHTPSPASSGHSSTSAKPCRLPECGPQSVPTGGNDNHLQPGKKSSHLAAVLCSLVAMGCLALVILFLVCGPRDDPCFKQAFAKLCNEGAGNAAHKPAESNHQFPRDSFRAKQQQQQTAASSVSTANLGPVHVHNPGTVIFSLLSHFTGQVGPTVERGKAAERQSSEEEERDCPVFHPTASPAPHLSEEERSAEMDRFFFPSQEQGKDCHISKEEAL